MIYPDSFEQKIGFDKIRTFLHQRCLSQAAGELVDQMHFDVLYEPLEEELKCTDQMRTICMLESGFPEDGYEDMLPLLHQIEVQPSYYPDVISLRRLQRGLETVRGVLRFFEKTREDAYPNLKALCASVEVFPAVLQRLDALLDKFGNLRESASPQLADICQSIRQKEQQVSRRIQSILKQAQEQGLADSEATVSVRDGRMVIPVAAANKNKIQGYIYDESSSGKTSYIEPMEVVNLNNQIRELEFAKQREVIRILSAFADFLRPYVPDLQNQARFLARMDFLRAKARLAMEMNAGRPVLLNESSLNLIRARHPLLEKALHKEGKEIVPLSLRLDAMKRILLISGPNAGGKSVCLKTVGLLQYMLQCGLLVPAAESSEFGIFTSIFIDIGDQQSLENDLSTYSSHLMNMRQMLLLADSRSLLLLDEFGSGTEPTAGGAIAEALLEKWEEHGCFGVMTTHYTNLKLYATAGNGVFNGAMQFDVQRIEPLFRLETGVPGNSFAFELAQKMGLPQELLAEARNKAGTGFVDMEKQIKSIARNRRRWEEKVAKIRQTDRTLETITDKYQNELSEIQALRKQLLSQAKAQAQQIVEEANRRVENTIKEIKESQAQKEKTKEVRQQLKQFQQQLEAEVSSQEDEKIARKMEQLQQRQQRQRERKLKRAQDAANAPAQVVKVQVETPLQVGDKIRTKDGGLTGEILRVSGKKYSIGIGQIVTQTTADNLQRISANEYRSSIKSGSVAQPAQVFNISERKLNFSHSIDIRGQRLDQALEIVSHFIDDAFMVGAHQVKILHGTGTGVLRSEIRRFLQGVGGIASISDEHVEMGGAGITVVTFE